MKLTTTAPNPPLLCPEGVVFLTATASLVAADLHLGKAAAFRARGLPVPDGDSARDLDRLAELAARHSAREIIIAGDLFHAPTGITPDLIDSLEGFLARTGIPLHLVVGNHDAKFAALPARLPGHRHLDRSGVRIVHDPDHVDPAAPAALHLAGHWHPVVRIRDSARTSLRLPCFLLRAGTLVLPAFGSFTGGGRIAITPGDRVFVPLRDQIAEIPPALLA